MISTTFNKSHLTYDEQIELLESRGLTFKDKAFARNKLEHISYYRLSAYYLPFQIKKDLFKEGKTFEDVLELYYFDKELRKIIFHAIETIEVNIRANIVYNLSEKTGAFGYMEKDNLNIDYEGYINLLQSIQRETKRSKELFVTHFKEKYKSHTLPIWMVIELISFGTLSKLFTALKPEQETMTKKAKVPPEVFKNWLHVINYIRNICAHHSRLWNKQFIIKAKIPRKIERFNGLKNDKMYTLIVTLDYLIERLGTSNGFMDKIEKLLSENPNVDKTQMGFPNKNQDTTALEGKLDEIDFVEGG